MMGKRVIGLRVMLFILAAAMPAAARTQEQRRFEDVPASHWAYHAIASLQRDGLLVGYPADYFSTKRVLTRYEFAVALHRALNAVPPGASNAASPAGAPPLTAADLDDLRRLTAEFKSELDSVGEKSADVESRLAAAATYIHHSGAQAMPATGRQPLRALGPGPLNTRLGLDAASQTAIVLSNRRSGLWVGGATGAAAYEPEVDLLPAGIDGANFRLNARVGRTATSVWAGSYANVGADSFAPPGRAIGRELLAGSGRLDGGADGGLVPQQGAGLRFGIPVTRYGEVGVSVADFAADSLLAPGNNVMVYGGSLRLRPYGRLQVAAEGARSVSSLPLDPTLADANNAFRLGVGYDSGVLRAEAGYQRVDPGFGAAGYWSGLPVGYDLSNTQGPFVRLGYRLGGGVQGYFGGDFLGVAQARSGLGAFGSSPFSVGDSLTRASAGLRWNLSRAVSLHADYQGVFLDPAGLSSLGSGPIEQYFTIGTGLNLSGNTVLKLAYQIISVRDTTGAFTAGSGSLLDPSGSTAVFTTQVAVHF